MGEQLKLKSPDLPDGMQDSDILLKDALEEREKFLEKSPWLRNMQKEIDRRLRNSGSVENRIAVLGIMNDAKIEKALNKLSFLLELLKKMRDFFTPGK